MESPPSGSTWLEAFPSSDDSGLLLTSGSISSSSGEGCHCTLAMELQDSDDDGKSLSHEGSLDYSDGMSCENFNTLKKGPGWPEFYSFENGCDGKLVPIDPPPEFQDSPPLSEVYQTVPGKNMLVGQCRQMKSISRVSSASERRYIEKFSGKFVASILAEALSISCKVTWSIHCSQDCHPLECELGKVGPSASPRLCWTPELPLVPRTCPGSRASPASPLSRHSPSVVVHEIPPRSESHAGEIGDVYNVPFDSDVYAVPVDVVRPVERADGGASVPLVTTSRKATQPPQRPGRRHLRKRRRHPASGSRTEADRHATQSRSHPVPSAPGKCVRVPSPTSPTSPQTESSNKRHSVPGPGSSPVPPAATTARCQGVGRSSGGGRKGRSSTESRSAVGEPIHMTLQEVRQYLRNLYSGTGGGRGPGRGVRQSSREGGTSTAVDSPSGGDAQEAQVEVDSVDCKAPGKSRSSHAVGNGKVVEGNPTSPVSRGEGSCNRPSSSTSGSRHGFSTNLRQTLCSIFRLRRMPSSPGRRHARRAVSSTSSGSTTLPAGGSEGASGGGPTDSIDPELNLPPPPPPPFTGRALPPLPLHSSADGIANRPPAPIPEGAISPLPEEESRAGEAEDPLVAVADEPSMDFASSIEKVKDYGWYWGPISGEAAEKILSNEPDGSFIVRDSSDDHYIFSLTFKLNGCVRHVRIEHDQGNFSFGSCTKFKSHTIVDFIENAVEHSRSGRYLFFLHRRPVLGPMRVQLLHPVSRFKQVQSLQHMCRFVILKVVRRDLIQTLPLPRRIIDYLSTPHYYSEQPLEEERSGSSGAGSPGGEGLARAAAATASTTPIIIPPFPPPPPPNNLPPHGPS